MVHSGALRAFLLAAVLLPRIAAAAHLAGVVENERGDVLPYAPVQVLAAGTDSTVVGTHADSTGRFALDIPAGTYDVRVQYIGHRGWQRRIAVREPDTRLHIALETRPIVSADVVVTAARRPEATSASSASVSAISGRQIAIRGVSTFDQALETAEGVQVYRAHSIATNSVSIRGASDVLGGGVGNRVLLLVDGRPALAPESGGQTWSLLPLGIVDRVEVVKGAFSALYGSSAMGGVINLITRTPVAPFTVVSGRAGFYEKPPTWASWRSGHSFLSGASVTHGGERGGTGYLVHVSRDASDGHRQSSDYAVWQGWGKVRRALSRGGEIYVLAGGGRSRAGYPHRWISAVEPLLVPAEKRDDRQNKEWWSTDVAGTMVRPGGNVWNGGLYGYGNRSTTVQVPGRLESSVNAWRLGGRLQWQRRFGESFMQTVGTDIAADMVRSDSVLYGDRELRRAAVFALSELTLGKYARADFGIRYDETTLPGESAERELNPKIGVSVPLGHTLTFRASAGRAFRSPSIAERFLVLEPAGGTEFAPNDSLRAEKVVAYEAGITHVLGQTLRLDVAGFLNDYDDWIYWHELPADPANGRYRFQVANLLRVRMSGVEMKARFAPYAGVTVDLGYLYLRARDRTRSRTDDALPYRPRHTFSSVVAFEHGRLRTAFTTRARSAVEEEVFSAYQYDRPDAFAVTDLRLEYAVREWLSVGIDVDNAFDAQYEEMARFRMPGRTWSFTVRIAR